MHEVVHLSFGPQANALNTAFYNSQQNYFVYTKSEAAKSLVDPNVRFIYGREYTPRAVFWDFRNGFGKWKRFNSHYEKKQNSDQLGKEQQFPLEQLEADKSAETWTDNVEFPIHPHSLHTIPDWEVSLEFPYGRQRGAPEGQDRPFALMSEGQDQFRASCRELSGNYEDYLDVCLRPALEKCDMLDGVNIVSDLGGWGGFSGEMLEQMRDEHVAQKPIYAWLLSHTDKKVSYVVQRSRIEEILNYSEHATLVLPLQGSYNHLALFETVCLLSSLRPDRVSMHDMAMDLTIERPWANIVQSPDAVVKEFQNKTNLDVRNSIKIVRDATKPEHLGRDGDRDHPITTYWCPQPLPDKPCTYSLQVDNSPLNLRNIALRFDHELRERVGDLADEYLWGADSSDYD